MDVREDPGQYYPGGSVIPRTPEPAQERMVLDNTVTETSANGVKSSGIWSWVKSLLSWGNITGKPETFTPSNHLHSQSSVTGLLDALAGKLDKTGGSMTGSVTMTTSDGTTTFGAGGIYRVGAGGSISYPQQGGTLALRSEIPSVDSTLTTRGAAADAEAVGEALSLRLRTGFGNASISWSSTTGCIEYTAPSGECIHFPASAFDGTTFATLHDPAPSLTDAGVTALFTAAATSITTSGTALYNAVFNRMSSPFNQLFYISSYRSCSEGVGDDIELIYKAPNNTYAWTKTIHIIWAESGSNNNTIKIPRGITGAQTGIDSVILFPLKTMGATSFSLTWDIGTVGENVFVVLDDGLTWDEFAGSWDVEKDYLLTITELGSRGTNVFYMTKKEVNCDGIE